MDLGVNTHFSQHWNIELINNVRALDVSLIRDSQPWGAIETTRGAYSFPDYLSAYMARAKVNGIGASLTFASVNALYDSGLTPHTDEGRTAYANYILATLARYGDQVKSIEVWNEFNATGITGPALTDRAVYYSKLLEAVWTAVKPRYPDVKILGGSVYTVANGFLSELFAAGGLKFMDGIAVHPYGGAPEFIGDQIDRLKQIMVTYGTTKPVYATEFGVQTSNPAEAPDYMLKAITKLAAAGVTRADWYALTDEKWYSNMGLYTQAGVAKPAAASFSFARSSLLPLGDPVRVETGDPGAIVYRYGSNAYVMWGDARPITVTGATGYKNAMGQTIATPRTLGDQPVVVFGGDLKITFGKGSVLADSLYGFNQGAFKYYAKWASGGLTELSMVDWDWISYLGSKYTKPLRINADSIAPAGDGKSPIQAVHRYTATAKTSLEVVGQWKTGAGDGVDLHVLVNGKEIYSKIFVGAFQLSGLKVNLNPNDTLDIALGPNQYVTGDSSTYRIKLIGTTASSAKNVLKCGQFESNPKGVCKLAAK